MSQDSDGQVKSGQFPSDQKFLLLLKEIVTSGIPIITIPNLIQCLQCLRWKNRVKYRFLTFV